MEATDFTLVDEWLDFIDNDDLKTTMITFKSVSIMDEVQELSWFAMLQNSLPVLAIMAENDRIVDNNKVLQFIGEQNKVPLPRPDAPRNPGLALIGIGTFALIIACIQHWNYVRKLSAVQPNKPWDLALIVACLLALLGLLMSGSVIFAAGPFG